MNPDTAQEWALARRLPEMTIQQIDDTFADIIKCIAADSSDLVIRRMATMCKTELSKRAEVIHRREDEKRATQMTLNRWRKEG